jgi:NAD(P)-dependent dehydrogenase (short-subunit alcohol dehydrogenase family)
MNETKWGLILGASSGFGESTALELSSHGFSIAGVHLDRKTTLPHVEEIISKIKLNGTTALFFNMNAADEEKRKEVLEKLAQEKANIKIVLHSLAFGTLKSFIPANSHEEGITKSQLEMTLDVMAHSLVYWTQDLIRYGLMREGGRIFAMTSEGGTHIIPSYGAVSAAKAALESHVRQLAYELAPLKITINAIRAGVTDTPALRKIPGNENLVGHAKIRNPHGRLTTPEDVAKAIAAFSSPETAWMTGNVIGVDGGECIVA